MCVCTPDHPTWFPDPSTAEGQGPAAGLAAVGGDLEPERLLAAYAQGFFPWYDAGSPLLVVARSALRALARIASRAAQSAPPA